MKKTPSSVISFLGREKTWKPPLSVRIGLGQFSDCDEPGASGTAGGSTSGPQDRRRFSVEQVLRERTGDLGIPVLADLPVGHEPGNGALPLGWRARLDADAGVLRLLGYRVDVLEFVDSRHTPRNVLLRAERTGAPATEQAWGEHAALSGAWGCAPYLADVLAPELEAAHAR